MGYFVERAELAAHEETFLRVLSTNLGPEVPEGGTRPQMYRWFYVENPAGSGVTFLLRFGEEAAGGSVVGCTGIGLRGFDAEGRSRRAGLLVDFAVDQEHRSLQPALRLQRAVKDWARTEADFAYGFPNPPAVGVFRRLGYHEGTIDRYVRVLRYEPFLTRLVPIRPLAKLGGAILDVAVSTMEKARDRRIDGFQLEWIREPDARFDRLWEEARGGLPLVGDRGASFLRWRFTRHPGGPGSFAALVHEDTGALGAYAVVKRVGEGKRGEPGMARIQDFLASTPVDLKRLLATLAPSLRARGFSSVEVEFAGPKRLTGVLVDSGFVRRDGRPFIADPGGDWSGESQGFANAEGWYLTHADTDT